MLIEETKRTLSMRPITLLVYFVCLIGLSVSMTYLIGHATYKKQLDNKDQQILAAQKNNKALADKNIKLRNSLKKLGNEYSNLKSRYKDLASKLDSDDQKNTQTASKLTLALKDLETAKADALRFEGMNAKLQAFKDILAPYLVLEPTWVSSGESTSAFDGNLTIALYEASANDKCRKDSAASGYLIRGKRKKKLCLQTGKPEVFKYRGKTYLFKLLESKEGEGGSQRYCISILKRW